MAVSSLAACIFIALPLCITVYTLLWILYCITWHPLAKVPGPFWASVTRLWYMYRIYVGDMERVQRALHQRYGPVIRIAPNEVSSAEPSAIPLIYRTQAPLLKTDFYPIWGSGTKISEQPDLFTCIDERVHSQARRVVNPVYSLSNILKNEKNIQKCTQLFIQKLGSFADRKQSVDLGQWVQMYTFDVIGELTFGGMFGFLESGEDFGSFIASIDALMPVMCIAAISPTYYRPFIMGASVVIPTILRAIRAVESIKKASLAAVARRKEQVEKGTANRYDLLQQMMDIVREKGEKVNFTEKEVSLHCWANMFAGSDSTAIAIRACFYYLSKNPQSQKKVQAELDAASPSLSSPIKYIESMQLQYLCACIKEAMRLFPSVALSLQRTSPQQGLDLSGKHIPRGYRVGVNPAVVHYNEDVFGADPEKFKPERWLVGGKQLKVMEKASLIFGAGTRVCSGKNISLAEIYTVVPEVLRQFNLEIDHDRPWKTTNHWFNKQTNMVVKITRHNSSI